MRAATRGRNHRYTIMVKPDAFQEMRDAFCAMLENERSSTSESTEYIEVDNLRAYSGQQHFSPWQLSVWDGGKFFGGFNATDLWLVDYWTLRARSHQLFTTNLYARGFIRRLITNEINTGLTPEACPEGDILNVPDSLLDEWTETRETRFGLWARDPILCDYYGTSTFGKIQRDARREALVCGDVLVVLHHSRRTGLPTVQLISGDRIQSPLTGRATLSRGHSIRYGVEVDVHDRQVAYWVRQKDGSSKRLPAWGEKSGRRIAWLVYGSDKRYDDLRGQPLLALVLQSVQEVDRYRDSMQRKAVNNSMIAGTIEKTQDKLGTLPITGGAVRKDVVTLSDGDGESRELNITQHLPGTYFERLAPGEKLVAFQTKGTDEAFGSFEDAIIAGIAWANEIPPEILRLKFSNNYSASQAAINEFRMYLNLIWYSFGEEFCTPIYIDHLLAETLMGKNTETGILDAWRSYSSRYDEFGAWTAVEWYGSIKPSADPVRQTKASQALIAEGWSTNAREARVLTGTKFSRNIKRLTKENQQKTEARQALEDETAEAPSLLPATNGE